MMFTWQCLCAGTKQASIFISPKKKKILLNNSEKPTGSIVWQCLMLHFQLQLSQLLEVWKRTNFRQLCSILLLLVGERESKAGFLDQTKSPELAVLAVTVLKLLHPATSFMAPFPWFNNSGPCNSVAELKLDAVFEPLVWLCVSQEQQSSSAVKNTGDILKNFLLFWENKNN